jgi:hypothetical protein
MKEIGSSWWWLLLVPAAFVLSYCGGYLASIRNRVERWKPRTGFGLTLLAFTCLTMVNIFTPVAAEIGDIVILASAAVYALTLTLFFLGFANRRRKSEYQTTFL